MSPYMISPYCVIRFTFDPLATVCCPISRPSVNLPQLNSPPALGPLPLCHYCCHRGTGNYPVHYFQQCICDDRECTCRCYCTGAQLEHKLEVFPVEFLGKSPVDTVDVPRAKDVAEARVKKLANKPCWNPSCVEDMLKDTVGAPLFEAFLISKSVILVYFQPRIE